MDSAVLIPLISGFVGTLVGALASISTIIIQQRAQSKRDRVKLACEMAKHEHQLGFEVAKLKGKAATIQPLSIFQQYHYEVLRAMESGTLNGDNLVKIKKKNAEVMQTLEKYYEKRLSEKSS